MGSHPPSQPDPRDPGRPEGPGAGEGAGERACIRSPPGEIIGFRAWRVREGNRLFSIFYDSFEWFPGLPAEGDPDLKVPYYPDGAGIHAFKTFPEVDNYIGYTNPPTYSVFSVADRDLGGSIGYVIGEVELWGTVAEHTIGYRAQFARPIKFLVGLGVDVNLGALRARYLAPSTL